MGCITSPKLTEDNYIDLTIAPFTKNKVEILVKQYSDLEIGEDFINLALKVSAGNPSIVEQMVLLYKDIRRNGLKHITYNSIESILDARLGILKQEDLPSYRMLIAMSVLNKFQGLFLCNNIKSDITNIRSLLHKKCPSCKRLIIII